MNGNNIEVQTGWFDSVKEKLGLNTFLEKLNLSKERILEIGIYLGIGFVTGFLIKKYATYIIIVIGLIVALVVLQQMNIVNFGINWVKVQEVFGIQPTNTQADLFTTLWEWIKLNFVIVVSFSIGFLFGLKVG